MVDALRGWAREIEVESSPAPTPTHTPIGRLSIATIPLGVADTEVLYKFPIGTKSFIMHSRNGNVVRMSTQQNVVGFNPTTESRDPRFTLKANTVYSEDQLQIKDFTQDFYFSCSTANEVLEVIIGV